MARDVNRPPPHSQFSLGFVCWDLPAGSTQEEGEDLRDTPVLEKTDRGQHVSVAFSASGPVPSPWQVSFSSHLQAPSLPGF